MATGGRKTQLQVVHEISGQLAQAGPYTQAQLVAGVLIGVIPAGAILGNTRVITPTAWNGTVSVVVNIGTTPNGTELVAASDVRTAAARADAVVPIARSGPLAADTPIYASLVFGGTFGTAGLSVVGVEYWPGIG